jgi:hypothetical protein
MVMKRVAASYKDPGSGVFTDEKGEAFYRSLPHAPALYNDLGFFPRVGEQKQPGHFAIEKLPFVSYYLEWNLEQFRDSGLFYLDVLKDVLKKGYTLSDATPLNITYTGKGQFVFMDHGSVITRTDNSWPSQYAFLKEYIVPLMYLRDSRVEVAQALLPMVNQSDWVLAYRSPWWKRLTFSQLVIESTLKLMSTPQKGAPSKPVSSDYIENSIMFYRDFLERLQRRRPASKWGDYYERTITAGGYLERKEQAVLELVGRVAGDVNGCVDLGASTGYFPERISEAHPHMTYVAVEGDPNAYVQLYTSSKRHGFTPVFSNVLQLTPAFGFEGCYQGLGERLSAFADLLLVLGLVHHLKQEGGMTFERLFSFFHSISRPRAFLLIEYIDPEDDKYRLIRNPNHPYVEDRAGFEQAMADRYDKLHEIRLLETRTLYLARKRD